MKKFVFGFIDKNMEDIQILNNKEETAENAVAKECANIETTMNAAINQHNKIHAAISARYTHAPLIKTGFGGNPATFPNICKPMHPMPFYHLPYILFFSSISQTTLVRVTI
jgi:hypothetical protein